MHSATAPDDILHDIVAQHAEEACFTWVRWKQACLAIDGTLSELAVLEDRVDAHIEGLRYAGTHAREHLRPLLASSEEGALFAPAVLALESGDLALLRRLLAVAEADTSLQSGLLGAFEWVPPARLAGLILPLLESDGPFARHLAIASCAHHRVPPTPRIAAALHDPQPALRSRTLRYCGEVGALNLLDDLLGRLNDDDSDCAFWAAWSAVLLGDRAEAVERLWRLVADDFTHRRAGVELLLCISDRAQARQLLRQIAEAGPPQHRLLLWACACSGDLHFAPWLIRQMEHPEHASLAAEAFSMLTGASLAAQPEPQAASAWWAENQGTLDASAVLIEGVAASPEACLQLMATGRQARRAVASLRWSTSHPGHALLVPDARAGRQRRWLASLKSAH